MASRGSNSPVACASSQQETALALVVPGSRTPMHRGMGKILQESQKFCLDLHLCATLYASFLAWIVSGRSHGLARWRWNSCTKWSGADLFCAVAFQEVASGMLRWRDHGANGTYCRLWMTWGQGRIAWSWERQAVPHPCAGAQASSIETMNHKDNRIGGKLHTSSRLSRRVFSSPSSCSSSFQGL